MQVEIWISKGSKTQRCKWCIDCCRGHFDGRRNCSQQQLCGSKSAQHGQREQEHCNESRNNCNESVSGTSQSARQSGSVVESFCQCQANLYCSTTTTTASGYSRQAKLSVCPNACFQAPTSWSPASSSASSFGTPAWWIPATKLW